MLRFPFEAEAFEARYTQTHKQKDQNGFHSTYYSMYTFEKKQQTKQKKQTLNHKNTPFSYLSAYCNAVYILIHINSLMFWRR